MDTPQDAMYNPLSPEAIADPYVFYHRLREKNPVYWHSGLDSWVVTGHGECRQVLGDTAAFGSDFRRVGEDTPEALLSVQSLDPPEHGRIRHHLVAALHEQPASAMADRVSETASAHVARLGEMSRPVDLISDLARPVALRSVCGFLGVETPDGPHFEEMSNAIVRSMDSGLEPERAAPGILARNELSRMVGEWLESAPDDGFIGATRRAVQADPHVSRSLLENSLRAVLHAGYESVSRLLGNALARLVANPALLSEATGSLRLDALADELIRLDTPVQADARVCVTDGSLGGERVRRGDVAILFLAAANRDPLVFPRPDIVDMNRPRGLHMSFGRGAHACLGSMLAIMQLRAVLSALQSSKLAFEPAAPGVYERTATLRGLSSLPVSVRGAE